MLMDFKLLEYMESTKPNCINVSNERTTNNFDQKVENAVNVEIHKEFYPKKANKR